MMKTLTSEEMWPATPLSSLSSLVLGPRSRLRSVPNRHRLSTSLEVKIIQKKTLNFNSEPLSGAFVCINRPASRNKLSWFELYSFQIHARCSYSYFLATLLIQSSARKISYLTQKLSKYCGIFFTSQIQWFKKDYSGFLHCLKGQCHEIFDFWFFSWISFSQAPEYTIRAVSNFFENSRRYSQLKVCHRCQRHRWQNQKIFNHKSFNYFVWTPLGSIVNL